MDKVKTTPKDFFLWAGAMVALYWSVSAFIFLLFDYINFAYPDTLQLYNNDPYQSGASSDMASLIVLFPIFLVLMWFIHRDIVKDTTRSEVWVRRWALVLTLFLAVLSMVVDLVVLIHSFLNGDAITTAFIFKVLIVLGVGAVVSMHFLADLRGYWTANPMLSARVAWGVGLLMALTIASAFVIFGTPGQARLARFDAQKVSDLQSIQSEIVSYYQAKQKLPTTLNDLNNSLSYTAIPQDVQSNQPYGYHIVKQPYAFEICATFNSIGYGLTYGGQAMPMLLGGTRGIGGYDDWLHVAGPYCFERTIDPQLYPTTNVPLAVPAKPIQ